jgi:hypothetical protein
VATFAQCVARLQVQRWLNMHHHSSSCVMHYSANPKNIYQRPVNSPIGLHSRCGGASFTRTQLIRSHDSYTTIHLRLDVPKRIVANTASASRTNRCLRAGHQSSNGRIIALKSSFKLRTLWRQQSLAIAASRLALPFALSLTKRNM